jgi:hypothetical protein
MGMKCLLIVLLMHSEKFVMTDVLGSVDNLVFID